ncbi:hypothetical protein COL516b_009810 [Colletotrichum fioriniae]|nr:uncharacterized protein COL516b_009810 [Colletotrichum fioriniae]KAJ0298725.1 hypothetical protein COL516b_009810 [Colletotrichum fioriniae]
MDAVAKPSHNARRHKPSASLGSLYEVLADLDDNQLQYLIQEMNHTGHQNVPVSQAVSTFEALKSSSSPVEPFAVSETGLHAPAPDSPARDPLRNLSKSRRGRLSLQTAFQRAPSLKHRQRQQQQQQQQQPSLDSPKDDYLFRSSTFSQGPEPAHSHRPAKGYGELLSSPVSSCSSPAGGPVIMSGLPEPATVTRPTRYEEIEHHHIFIINRHYRRHRSLKLNSVGRLPTEPEWDHQLTTESLGQISTFLMTPNLHGRSPLRRSSSRLDLALGAERSASGAAEIGMGMLEPRQLRSVSLGFPGGGMATTMSMDSLSRSLKGETRPPAPAPVFEGIFDVLENQ